MSKRKLRLGISPCPNDTYIFAALIHGELLDCPFDFEVEYADVQTLNEKALRGEYDLVKVSIATHLNLPDSILLDAGGAMGYGCGPLLLSSQPELNHQQTVFLPGPGTTARLLFDFWNQAQDHPFERQDYLFFDQIYQKLITHEIQMGVAIHECRFTWQKDGLHLIQDLGDFWEQQTSLPIPLGGILLHPSLIELQTDLEHWIRSSIEWIENHPQTHLAWIQSKAQIEDLNVVQSHIKTYVNEFSRQTGLGQNSIQVLKETLRLGH